MFSGGLYVTSDSDEVHRLFFDGNLPVDIYVVSPSCLLTGVYFFHCLQEIMSHICSRFVLFVLWVIKVYVNLVMPSRTLSLE